MSSIYDHIIDSNGNSVRRNSDPSTSQSNACNDSVVTIEEEDEEMPLDMSKKKYRHSEGSESRATSEHANCSPLSRSSPNCLSQLFDQQMMRPSVITCAPKLLNSRSHSLSSKCENCVRGCGSAPNNDVIDGNGVVNASSEYNDDHNDRNSSLSVMSEHVCDSTLTDNGVSDPVIDEHFRRSLGKDYSQIFSNSANTASITVDDHFAKALGDTWIRLQKNIQT